MPVVVEILEVGRDVDTARSRASEPCGAE
jgi:hypothetical protein